MDADIAKTLRDLSRYTIFYQVRYIVFYQVPYIIFHNLFHNVTGSDGVVVISD